ncbi:MFS transporter [Paenibacillus elgii]|uniref:MFS transporter n=1 Tax=Paenibacillus elgii TaxID=189691 RepID=UPI000FD63BC0|nr:MFS transporter [Paenibacillus elgii]NEN86514.1 MFS transporter [Paenibacillus elgii]
MNRVITLFFCIMFIIGTDTFIASPLLPTLREAFGVSVERSGWIVSAYALGYALFALVAGPLSDGWNRKKVMIAGMASFGVFTLLCGVAADFWTMLLFRFLAGVSGAFVSPQVWAAIPQIVPPGKVLKAMGIATAGLAVAQMLGVPIGSYLAAFGWHTPFIAIGVASFMIMMLIALVLPSIPAPSAAGKAPSIVGRYRALLRESGAKKAFLAYFVFQLGNFATFSFIGTWLSDKFGLGVAEIGTVLLFLGLGNTLSSFFGSSVVQRMGRNSFILGMVVLVLIFPSLSLMESITYVKLAYFLIYFIMGMLFPLMMSLLQGLSSTARGTISSLANSSMYFGATLASSVAGVLYTRLDGFVSVSLFTVLCFIVSLLLFLRSGVLPARSRSESRSAAVMK